LQFGIRKIEIEKALIKRFELRNTQGKKRKKKPFDLEIK
jgi:hypothetical protein